MVQLDGQHQVSGFFLSNIENVNALESFTLYFKINWFVVLAKLKKTKQIAFHHQPQKNLHKGKKMKKENRLTTQRVY